MKYLGRCTAHHEGLRYAHAQESERERERITSVWLEDGFLMGSRTREGKERERESLELSATRGYVIDGWMDGCESAFDRFLIVPRAFFGTYELDKCFFLSVNI